MGSWGGEDTRQGGGWQTQRGGRLWSGERGGQSCSWLARQQLADHEVPHLRSDKLGGTTGEQPRVPLWGTKTSKPLTKNTCGG